MKQPLPYRPYPDDRLNAPMWNDHRLSPNNAVVAQLMYRVLRLSDYYMPNVQDQINRRHRDAMVATLGALAPVFGVFQPRSPRVLITGGYFAIMGIEEMEGVLKVSNNRTFAKNLFGRAQYDRDISQADYEKAWVETLLRLGKLEHLRKVQKEPVIYNPPRRPSWFPYKPARPNGFDKGDTY